MILRRVYCDKCDLVLQIRACKSVVQCCRNSAWTTHSYIHKDIFYKEKSVSVSRIYSSEKHNITIGLYLLLSKNTNSFLLSLLSVTLIWFDLSTLIKTVISLYLKWSTYSFVLINWEEILNTTRPPYITLWIPFWCFIAFLVLVYFFMSKNFYLRVFFRSKY